MKYVRLTQEEAEFVLNYLRTPSLNSAEAYKIRETIEKQCDQLFWNPSHYRE